MFRLIDLIIYNQLNFRLVPPSDETDHQALEQNQVAQCSPYAAVLCFRRTNDLLFCVFVRLKMNQYFKIL